MSKTATLKLETCHLIPGLKEDFDAQVNAAIDDCKRRPAVTKKRTVILELAITPHATDVDDVWISPVIKSKRPATDIDPLRGRRTRNGQLQFDFSEDGLDDSGQQ